MRRADRLRQLAVRRGGDRLLESFSQAGDFGLAQIAGQNGGFGPGLGFEVRAAGHL
jgi:hypothetical protein